MSTSESRKVIYKRARATTALSKRDWSKIFSLGVEKGIAEVDKKEKYTEQSGSRGVNMPEALSSGLIEFLHKEGYDLSRIEFDDLGNLLTIPKLEPDIISTMSDGEGS